MAEVQTNTLIEAHALARHVRMSRKGAAVMAMIRGQRAQGSVAGRLSSRRRTARPSTLKKCVASAIANAELKARNAGARPCGRYRGAMFVNEGPAMEAVAPAPHGPGVPLPRSARAPLGGVASNHVAPRKTAWQPTSRRAGKRKRAVRGTARVFARFDRKQQAPKKGKK